MNIKIFSRAAGVVLAGAIAVSLAGCSGGGCTTQRKHGAEIDREAYGLGAEHARTVIGCKADTAELCGRLLDIRTRETDFRHRFGDATADSYVDGFESFIRDHDPELAKVLL